jgi:hypothetical protein
MEQKGMSTLGGVPNSFLFLFFSEKKNLDTQQNAEALKRKKERTQPTLAGSSSSSDGQCV